MLLFCNTKVKCTKKQITTNSFNILLATKCSFFFETMVTIENKALLLEIKEHSLLLHNFKLVISYGDFQ